MISLAVFDIAGTTVEEHQAVYAALAAAVTNAGAPADDADIGDWMGADKRVAIRALLAVGGGNPSVGDITRTYDDFRQRLDAAYAAVPPQPLAGVTDALETLRAAGIRIALTTGFDREVTDSVLKAVGWDAHLIDVVVCVDDVAAGRPAPYMIFRAMEATGTQSVHEVLTAGDTILDLRAGMNAGARYVVGVLSGGQDRATLQAEPHTHILDSVAAIPELLNG